MRRRLRRQCDPAQTSSGSDSGAPKQENWMYDHRDKVHGVMIGVGAGFDYHAGNIKRAPMWMQKLSLEWLYRLMQDPKRLFKRYLVTNTRYLWLTRTKRQ